MRLLLLLFIAIIGCGAISVNGQIISGKISDALTSVPISGATISIVEINKTFTTDDTGYFASESLGGGTFVLKAEAGGYLKQTRRIVVASRTQLGQSNMTVNMTLYKISTDTPVSATNRSLLVTYMFPIHDNVQIIISDSRGKIIRKAVDRTRQNGKRTFVWDGKDNSGKAVGPGKYKCQVQCGRLVMMRALEVE